MADYSPTIIAASLNDNELKNAINSLVQYVDAGTKTMSDSMTNAVAEMKRQLASLGNINVDMGGADGGSSRRTRKQTEETQAVKETTVAYDQLAQATGKTTGRMTIMETYDMQTKLLIERLKEVRADIDIFNSAIGSGKATQVEWGQRGLKEANAEAERLMRIISNLESKRDALNAIMQPQGHTIQNYVQSLQKVNPELALLNQQYKNGTALLQQKNVALRRSAQEEQQAAQESAAANARVAAYIEQGAERERQRRAEIQRTGQVAQESANQIMRSMYDQMSQDTDSPIRGLRELSDAIMKMRTAYFNMDDAGRESAIGQALLSDIARAEKALQVVRSVNMEMFRNQDGGDKISRLSSLESLNKSLKDLTSQYNRLTVAEIDAGKDTGIRQKYQDISRAAQILQRNLSRPVSFAAAMGLDENTLDNIAYKIRQLQAYKQGIDLTKPTAAQEIKAVDTEITRLENDMRKYNSQAKSVLESNNALSRSWNYMKNRLAFYFTVGASTAFVKNLIDVRAQYEMNERALGILINSAEKGTQIFKELSDMALVSPYTLIELSSATKQLVAYGIAAKDAVDTTRRLADMAAAVGVPMERLTYALGQIKAYGYLNSRDQRMFANAGIPLVQELAKHYTEIEGKLVSTADVYDRIKKRAVEYGDVLQVINKMTDEGGKFYDFQAKMADTLKVQLANLTLAWNNMLNEIGADSQGVISGGIKGLKQLFLHWKSIDEAIKNVAWTLGSLKAFQFVVLLFAGALKTAEGWTLLLGKRITELGIAFGKASIALATNPMTWVVTAIYSLVSLIRHFDQVAEAAKEMNRTIAKNAKEAYDSLDKYLGGEQAQNARKSAKSHSLAQVDAEKAFEDLRSQIELSSENANELIAPLLKIKDANDRLTAAFDLADKIKIATGKLSQLHEEAFKISQDSWLNGLFGEGLGEDVKDYVNYSLGKGWQFYKGQAKSEAEKEMSEMASDLAQVLRVRLGDDISDQTIVREAIDRFRKEIKVANPQIKGDVESWFDIKLDELLNKELGAVVDTQTSIQRRFITFLKKDYSSAFSMLTNDIIKEDARWSEDHEKTIKRAAEAYKQTLLPEFRSTVDEMLKHLNDQDFRVRVVTEMGVINAQPIYDTLTKADAAADSAYKKIERLQERQKQLQEKGGALSNDAKVAEESAKITQEIADAQKDYNDALEKGGRSQKENKESAKERKQAESELQKALKDELSLIDKVRSNYKKLTKDGVDSATALKSATSGFDETLSYINAVLGKYGIGKVDLTKYAGASNPIAIMNMLQSQLDALQGSGLAKPAEIKDLQVKLKDLEVESLSFKQETLIKSLNSELGKLKEEYELALELDANPELGENFASMFGIMPEALPHTIEEYADSALKHLNNYLKEGGQNLELPSLNLTPDDINMLSQLVDEAKLGKPYFDAIKKSYEEYYNLIKKSTTDVEKYISDYIKEYGDASAQLQEIENEKNEKLKELDAIYFTEELRQTQEYIDKRQMIIDASNKKLAKTSFERLKRSDDYERFFTAIDTLTKEDALKIKNKIKQDIIDAFRKGGLTIWQFRKEIKAVEQQFDKLSKASTIWSSYIQGGFDGAINRAKELGQELEIIGNKISANGSVDEKDQNWLNSLGNIFTTSGGESTNFAGLMQSFGGDMKGLGGAIGQAGAGMQGAASGFASAVAVVDTIIKNIHGAVEGINQMMSELNEGRSEDQKVGGWGWDAFSKVDQYVSSGWEKLKSGNILGAAMDTVNTFIAPIASIFRSRNKKITEQIEESERAVKKLAVAYNYLADNAEHAYGVEVSGAQQATIENKKLQLAEAERQLALEKSRKRKFQDKDKILELQGQVEDLKLEIKNASEDIVNELLGISSAGDEITSLVQVMIDAFRNGEDAMDAFGKEWDKMIDNMILKLIVSQYMKTAWDEIMATLKNTKDEMLNQASIDRSNIEAEIERLKTASKYELLLAAGYSKNRATRYSITMSDEYAEDLREVLIGRQNELLQNVEKELERASQGYTEWSLDYMMNEGRQKMLDAAQKLQEGIGEYYQFGELAEGQALSNLQQGIQGITEDTASALEAYMNSVSQQVYLHSDLLTQIRDAVVGFDLDVQLGVQSQMLLQLQNNYIVIQSMQSLMENWTTPAGNGIRVEVL